MDPLPARWLRAAAAVLLAAGALAGCGQLFSRASGCDGGQTTPVMPAVPVPSAVPSAVPPPVEALWVADEAGQVRKLRDDRFVATVRVGPATPPLPPVLVGSGGRLWVYRLDIGDIAMVNSAKGTVTRHVRVPAVRPYAANGLLYAHGSLWISQPGRLWRVTTKGVAIPYVLPAGFTPSGMVAADRWLWLVAGKRLLRLDPLEPAQVVEVTLPFVAGDLFAATDELYLAGVNSPVVHRLDRETGRFLGEVRLIDDELVLSLVGSGSQVWAAGNCGNLVRLSDRFAVRVSDVSQDLAAVAAQGSLWVGDEVRSEIVRIEMASGRVLARIPFTAADTDDPSFGLLAGRSSLWVIDGDFGGGVSRVDPATNQITRVVPAAPTAAMQSVAIANA